MPIPAAIVDELESALRAGSYARRVEVLHCVTDLFVNTAKNITAEQVAVFDDVICRLASEIESKALAELSRRLAPISNAPAGIVRRLAWDDTVEVAGPVLAKSDRLTDDDLIKLAENKSQGHLDEIATRPMINEPVTDVLVELGDSQVANTLAGNSGACFSDTGLWQLVMRAEGDERLAQTIGGRSDIPPYLFRQLLIHATDKVRQKLLASTEGPSRAAIADILADISVQMRKGAISRHYAEAQLHMRALGQDTERIKTELLVLAAGRKLTKLIAALSVICALPIELVEQLVEDHNAFGLLVLCKAASLDWNIVHAVIRASAGADGARLSELDDASAAYRKLSTSTAQRALRFWQVKKAGYRGCDLAPELVQGALGPE